MRSDEWSRIMSCIAVEMSYEIKKPGHLASIFINFSNLVNVSSVPSLRWLDQRLAKYQWNILVQSPDLNEIKRFSFFCRQLDTVVFLFMMAAGAGSRLTGQRQSV